MPVQALLASFFLPSNALDTYFVSNPSEHNGNTVTKRGNVWKLQKTAAPKSLQTLIKKVRERCRFSVPQDLPHCCREPTLLYCAFVATLKGGTSLAIQKASNHLSCSNQDAAQKIKAILRYNFYLHPRNDSIQAPSFYNKALNNLSNQQGIVADLGKKPFAFLEAALSNTWTVARYYLESKQLNRKNTSIYKGFTDTSWTELETRVNKTPERQRNTMRSIFKALDRCIQCQHKVFAAVTFVFIHQDLGDSHFAFFMRQFTLHAMAFSANFFAEVLQILRAKKRTFGEETFVSFLRYSSHEIVKNTKSRDIFYAHMQQLIKSGEEAQEIVSVFFAEIIDQDKIALLAQILTTYAGWMRSHASYDEQQAVDHVVHLLAQSTTSKNTFGIAQVFLRQFPRHLYKESLSLTLFFTLSAIYYGKICFAKNILNHYSHQLLTHDLSVEEVRIDKLKTLSFKSTAPKVFFKDQSTLLDVITSMDDDNSKICLFLHRCYKACEEADLEKVSKDRCKQSVSLDASSYAEEASIRSSELVSKTVSEYAQYTTEFIESLCSWGKKDENLIRICSEKLVSIATASSDSSVTLFFEKFLEALCSGYLEEPSPSPLLIALTKSMKTPTEARYFLEKMNVVQATIERGNSEKLTSIYQTVFEVVLKKFLPKEYLTLINCFHELSSSSLTGENTTILFTEKLQERDKEQWDQMFALFSSAVEENDKISLFNLYQPNKSAPLMKRLNQLVLEIKNSTVTHIPIRLQLALGQLYELLRNNLEKKAHKRFLRPKTLNIERTLAHLAEISQQIDKKNPLQRSLKMVREFLTRPEEKTLAIQAQANRKREATLILQEQAKKKNKNG